MNKINTVLQIKDLGTIERRKRYRDAVTLRVLSLAMGLPLVMAYAVAWYG